MPSLFKDIEPSITQKIEVYKKPPLAFCGNKKNAYNLLQSVIKELKHKADFKESELIVVDVFGGSGLLSHIFKQALPKARVIFNDYDDFQKRLDNIESTNEILAALNPPPLRVKIQK